MSAYESACHGWRPGENVEAERHPLAVYALIALPVLAAVVYGVAAS